MRNHWQRVTESYYCRPLRSNLYKHHHLPQQMCRKNAWEKFKFCDILKMCSVQEMQRVDRGLSSELVKSPINPAFLFMSVPLLDGYNPLFYVQLNGEVLWEWRSLRNPSQLFETLQDNLSRIAGYRLSSSSRTRLGTALYSRVQYIAKKLRNT